jgi:YD repeat-containing protein
MPAGKWRLRETVHDPLGRQLSASEWADLPPNTDPLALKPSNATTFAGYDTFDRIGRVTSPDGSTAIFTYTGDRIRTRTSQLATPGSPQTSVSTTERYDGFGRLTQIGEPSGSTSAARPAGANVTTDYTYDPAGHLATGKMTNENGTHQDRLFQYDGRGFLIKESNPENGDKVYSSYDARGHVLTRISGNKTQTFEYDAAEHLHKIFDQSGNVVKQFEYGTANNGDDLRNGKLVQTSRRNDLPSAGRIDVTEIYQYAGMGGQMSKRTTVVERVSPDGTTRTPIQQFEYGVDYDDLLLPANITMPTCAFGGCSSQTTQNGIGTVSNRRTAGYLTSVDGQSSKDGNVRAEGFGTFDYHPSGMVASVAHQTLNKPADVYDTRYDVPRPSKITFGSCSNTTPYFLPGSVVVKVNPAACGLQVTWPPAAICGGSSSIKYRVLRDGADVSGCVTGTTTFTDTTVVPNSAYAYRVVVEGPQSSGGNGMCQGGQTVQLDASKLVYNGCASGSSLATGDVTASVGIPATFQATLNSPNGPVPDEQLMFTILGHSITARTGSNGIANVTYALDVDPGPYAGGVIVEYAGGLLPPARATASLTM